MAGKKKFNESCVKIFKFLKLLYQNEADYNSVVEIFKEKANEPSNNNIQVNINKYINTLKIFGIKIKKENNKYKLLSNLYSMHFSLEDLKAICILSESVKNFPDDELKDEIQKLVKSLEFRMDNESKNTLNSLSKLHENDFSFYYSDIREQIEKCKNLCKDNFQINLLYKKNLQEVFCKCAPKEVIYDSKTAYFRVYDTVTRQYLQIPIENILSISKLPQLANNIEMGTTVVYKLKGRLAKIYKPKDNEYTDGFDSDGNLIIINKNEIYDELISRLMRYSYNCEIISPKSLRESMIKEINNTISNYN